MRTHQLTILAFATLSAFAGAARAQHEGDPGLDPRIAKYMKHVNHVDYQCECGGAGAGDSAPVLWPNGVVPVVFASGSLDALCLEAMDIWMFRSGTSPNVTFVYRDPANPAHNNYLYIYNVSGGVSGSYVGVSPGLYNPQLSGPPPAGGQMVYRGEQNSNYVMAHEFCHALGFFHEHTRPNRDSYVWVYLNRVQSGYQHNFNIVPDWAANSLNTGYDFDSIMHYHATSFSICNPTTCLSTADCTPLVARPDLGYGVYQCLMGQQNHLSTNDVQDMINVYGALPRSRRYVGPYGDDYGTLSHPYSSPAQFGGGGDVYFNGHYTYQVPAGTRFTQPATWRKHSSGIATITAP